MTFEDYAKQTRAAAHEAARLAAILAAQKADDSLKKWVQHAQRHFLDESKSLLLRWFDVAGLTLPGELPIIISEPNYWRYQLYRSTYGATFISKTYWFIEGRRYFAQGRFPYEMEDGRIAVPKSAMPLPERSEHGPSMSVEVRIISAPNHQDQKIDYPAYTVVMIADALEIEEYRLEVGRRLSPDNPPKPLSYRDSEIVFRWLDRLKIPRIQRETLVIEDSTVQFPYQPRIVKWKLDGRNFLATCTTAGQISTVEVQLINSTGTGKYLPAKTLQQLKYALNLE
jgi:hypothetical protein